MSDSLPKILLSGIGIAALVLVIVLSTTPTNSLQVERENNLLKIQNIGTQPVTIVIIAIPFASLDVVIVVSRVSTDVDDARWLPVPRLLTRRQAARYCGLTPSSFSQWVGCGRLPAPLAGTARWDLRAIDRALDSLSGLEKTEGSELDQWRSQRARRAERNP